MRITVYTTPACPHCRAAKRLLEGKGLAFEEIDVSAGDDFDRLVEQTGWRTVPQIFLDDRLIGGYQELAEMDRQGELPG